MLKKVLCLIIVTMTIIATCAVGADAAIIDVAQTDKQMKTLMMGDVDFDSQVSIMDATTIQRYLADMIELSADQMIVAKTTSTDYISVIDVTEIQRFIAGYECRGCTGEFVEVEDDDDGYVGIDYDYIEKAVEERFLEYINEERKAVGVQCLYTNATLMSSAKIRGDELVIAFSHTRPDGSSCFTAVKNDREFWGMGENIAYNCGYVHFANPETREEQIDFLAWKFFDQFKNSPGHYENMIRKTFNCHGAGVTINVDEYGNIECYIAHMFGETR